MKHLKSLFFPSLLIFITAVICFLNYSPGTFLTGWDTLHPEFNFAQQFSNEIFGVFRTDQGLGAVAAHAHMSELPRLAVLWIEHFFLPLSFLRYSIAFICFILGSLGIYYFVRKLLTSSHKSYTFYQNAAAFLAALIYIFNLEVVQQFYVPFEMFLVQYAALGWLFLFTIKFINERQNKNLLIFAFITLLASPMAYASVLWFGFFGSYLLFLFTYYLCHRTKKTFKSILILIGVTFLINSYWLLPNLYFLITTASTVSAAQTNKIFSDEAFLYNKQYGNLLDTAILKNFLFSWSQQISRTQSQDLLLPWKNHLSNIFTLSIGYLIFALSIFGIVISFLRKNKVAIALVPFFALSLVMVINMNPPFEFFFSILRDKFDLFKEGLRFPYTKFAPLLIFAISAFAGICAHQIMEFFSKIEKNKFKTTATLSFILISSLLIIWYGFPMFQGQLIDPQMRIKIPNEYFQLFDYMKSQPKSARLAPLPLDSIWGWEYYNWGYQGAGFLWFGVPQPVLARDFDRWNNSNEQFYREMSAAIYSRDVTKVESLAAKYRISYFLLDISKYTSGTNDKSLWHYETQDTFDKSGGKISLVKKFGQDLFLYKVDDSIVGSGFIQKPKNITFVGPKINGGFVDLAAQNVGDYVISDDPTFTYPSRSLVNRYDRIDPSSISFSDGKIILNLGDNNGGLLTNSWLDTDIFPNFMRSKNYDLTTEEKGLPYTIGNETFFSIPLTSPPSNLAVDFIGTNQCGQESAGTSSNVEMQSNLITFEARGTSSCGYLSFPNEKQDFGSMLLVEAENVKGLPLRICISSKLTERCDIYTSLDQTQGFKKYVFMIPPQPSGATGYEVHFNNVGIGNTESINSIRYVQFIQIPYYRIANLSFIKNGFVTSINGLTINSKQEINPTLYNIYFTIKPNQSGLIALLKAFDNGWAAFSCQNQDTLCKFFPFIFGHKINHVEINNWANGWIINQPQNSNIQTLIIIYLPQYLEYFGFLVLILAITTLSTRLILKRSSTN